MSEIFSIIVGRINKLANIDEHDEHDDQILNFYCTWIIIYEM